MNISSDKLEEFTVLFEEFINSYPNTPKGIKHIKSYSQQRESGCRNYQAILEAKEAGEDITDRVLLQLLPYRDTKNNREQGAWIHIAPVGLNNHIKEWFEKLRWTKSEDWHEVANLIFNFINYSVGKTETLSINCHNFHHSTYSKGLQTGYMTPILNALNPDCFILINNKLGLVIEHFTDTNFSHKLIDYPAVNQLARQLIKELSSIISQFDLPALRQDDLFNMFCYWLVIDKKYNFQAGLEKSDLLTKNSVDLICEDSLEEYKPKENNKMPKAHPDSYFSQKALTVLKSTINQSDEYTLDYQYELKIPFINICKDVISHLPSNIKKIIPCKNSKIEQEFWGFKYETDSKQNTSFFSTRTELYIWFEDCNLYFGLCIDIYNNSELAKERLTKNISSFQKLLNYSLLKCLSDKTDGDIERYLNTDNGYLTFTIDKTVQFEELLCKSKKELIDIIIQSINYFYLIALVVISDNPEQEIEEHLKIWNPKYKLEKYIDATYIEESQLNTWIKSITRKKQAIFYGSPGTGKTFIAENIAQYLIGGGDGFYELIQFHPAYSYEDFIQGIRPQTKDNGQLSYNLVPGRFLAFCNQAAECKDKCVLIIDEINRANLAEVFGELMYLLEYREQEICLAGSQEKFKIPDNVYLIGTMNTADRSIALVDFALRRRFAFIKIAPNYDIITKFHQQHTHLEVTGLITVLREINNLIEDENYYLGISFFLIETLTEDLENIWQMEIEPYLEEYFCDRLDEIKQYQWQSIKNRILPDHNSIKS